MQIVLSILVRRLLVTKIEKNVLMEPPFYGTKIHVVFGLVPKTLRYLKLCQCLYAYYLELVSNKRTIYKLDHKFIRNPVIAIW